MNETIRTIFANYYGLEFIPKQHTILIVAKYKGHKLGMKQQTFSTKIPIEYEPDDLKDALSIILYKIVDQI